MATSESDTITRLTVEEQAAVFCALDFSTEDLEEMQREVENIFEFTAPHLLDTLQNYAQKHKPTLFAHMGHVLTGVMLVTALDPTEQMAGLVECSKKILPKNEDPVLYELGTQIMIDLALTPNDLTKEWGTPNMDPSLLRARALEWMSIFKVEPKTVAPASVPTPVVKKQAPTAVPPASTTELEFQL